jgi:transposase
MGETERLQAENGEFKAMLAKLLVRIDVLLARIDELEGRLKQDSGNSSKPPSSDLGRKRKPPVEPSGRKRGGQPGHGGKTRDLVPEPEVDAVVDLDPEQCERCAEPLGDMPRIDACIRQICETPEFKAFIQQFNLWLKRCPKCGHLNRGQMPSGAPKGAFGPRLQARIGILTGRYRMTRREVVSLSQAMFGVRISLGSTQACCKAVSEAAAETAQAIHAEVKAAPVVHADETGFGRCGKDRMWLWLAAGGDAEAFRLLPGRGWEQAEDLLGKGFSGILHRDRWKPYEKLTGATHQLCHSHIRRDFQSMLESMGETGTQGCMLKLASDQAFHLWHQFERDEIDRKALARGMKPIQADIRQRLEALRDGPGTTKKARGTAKDLLRQWDSLWTYVHHDGAEPTNNEAERSIRKAVLWRKVSLGVDSEDGARFAERMLTLAGTARRRGINLLEWLTRALQANLEGRSAPDFQAG